MKDTPNSSTDLHEYCEDVLLAREALYDGTRARIAYTALSICPIDFGSGNGSTERRIAASFRLGHAEAQA